MPELIWFLVGLIVVLFVVSWLWQVFGVSTLFANLTPLQKLLLALLGLLLIIAILWWFFSRYMPVGFLS